MKTAALLEAQTASEGSIGSDTKFFRKLKPGPGRTAAEVVADQRARLRRAMVELVAERGFNGVTVRGLSRTAGVSTRTFYAHFPNAEECFAATYESVMKTALKRITAQGITSSGWERAIRSGLRALMEAIGENPHASRLALVESFSAGPAMLREMTFATRDFEQFMLDTFESAPRRAALPLPIIQGIAAGTERVVRARVLGGQASALPGVSEELADWALSMYGPTAAKLPIPTASEVHAGAAGRSREVKRSAVTGEFTAPSNERGRILAATIRLSATECYWNLTIPRIRREAEVSRRAFDSQFGSVAECYLEAIEMLIDRLVSRSLRSAGGAGSWDSRVVKWINAYCAELSQTPVLARLAYLDVFAPGQEGMTCRERIITGSTGRLRLLNPELTELQAEASSAAAWRIIQSEVAANRIRKLPQVAPLIAFVVLAPAVGVARAAKAIHAEHGDRTAPQAREGEIAHAIP
jgi:AcrR family transcriptional regulator